MGLPTAVHWDSEDARKGERARQPETETSSRWEASKRAPGISWGRRGIPPRVAISTSIAVKGHRQL